MIVRHWQTTAFRIALLLGFLFCFYVAARRGVAAWYFQGKSPEAVQTAIHWDRHNPEYLDTLATLMHFYARNENPSEEVKLYEQAVQLSPHDAQFWADLGSAYEWTGRRDDALRALERARNLFPNSPEINWKLANFYVRQGQTDQGLRVLRKVLLEGEVPRREVFALATSATRDNAAILKETIPPQPGIFLDYLNFQAGEHVFSGAWQTWSALLALKESFDVRQSFSYLDVLVQERDVQHLAEAWSILAKRFPNEVGSLSAYPSLVTNGSFESDLLNGGLDWRVAPVEGAIVSMDPREAFEGKRSLRIAFDGTHNLDYFHVFQYVLVRPNARYQFSGYMHSEGITTDSGPRFQIFDPYDPGKLLLNSDGIVGDSGWTRKDLQFETPADTSLVVIRIARSRSEKFDNKIAGTLWIDKVSLVPEQQR